MMKRFFGRYLAVTALTLLFTAVQFGNTVAFDDPSLSSIAFAKKKDKDKDNDKRRGLRQQVNQLQGLVNDLQQQLDALELQEGPQGPQGPAGPAGADGAQGPQGETGPAGPQGPIGLTGPAGADGADGADGANGTDGADGADGADGLPGPQGPIGLQGPAGPQGPAGVDGANAEFIMWSGFCSNHGRAANAWVKYCTDGFNFSTASHHIQVAPNGDITALVPGYYRINAWSLSNVSNSVFLELRVNGIRRHQGRQISDNRWVDITMDMVWPMNAGDVFNVYYWGYGGNNFNYHAGNQTGSHSRLEVSYMGPLN